MGIQFTKMQGLGNDFAVIDATAQPFTLKPEVIRQMADRRLGIGFDQMLVLEASQDATTDFVYRIFNADGGEVEQCGNGARCIARFIQAMGLQSGNRFRVKTLAGVLTLAVLPDHTVRVEMGYAQFPASQTTTLSVAGQSYDLYEVRVGNPHAVMQVEQINPEQVASLGAVLSVDPHFPAGVNVGFMRIVRPDYIQLRVYERGAGPTQACGSGACAAVAVGRRLGVLSEEVTVEQPGGRLVVSMKSPEAPIWMQGPAEIVYRGEWL